jgi:hypothetical protein
MLRDSDGLRQCSILNSNQQPMHMQDPDAAETFITGAAVHLQIVLACCPATQSTVKALGGGWYYY